MVYVGRPALVEAEDALFLYVSTVHKERAKLVAGHQWDNSRKCWRYPRDERVRDALYAEFGDELLIKVGPLPQTGNRVERPTANSQRAERKPPTPQRLPSPAPLPAALDKAVVSQLTVDAETVRLRGQLAAAKEDLTRVQRDRQKIALLYAEAKTRLAESEKRSAKPEPAVASKTAPNVGGNDLVDLLRRTAGNSPRFVALLDDLRRLDPLVPTEIHSLLEVELRLLLGVSQPDESTLYDLLKQAEEQQILNRDALDLAHMIRKQRNTIAHARDARETYDARSLLCLVAAALLWPELARK
jgi:hypothetical protein